MLAPVLITPPAVLPVSLDDLDGAKAQARVEGVDENGLIDAYIEAATAHLDGYAGVLGRALVNQTWRQDFRCWGVKMRLPLAPVPSIVSVTYFDADNVQQTLAPAIYALRADALGPYIDLVPDASWPAIHNRPDAVSVTFIAGYGPTGTDVPEPIRQAIRMMAAHWINCREGESGDLPGVRAMISPYRRANV